MGYWNRGKTYSLIFAGVLVIFFSIMAYVLGIAFLRQSGSTGLDMATIQKIRYDSQPPHLHQSTPHQGS